MVQRHHALMNNLYALVDITNEYLRRFYARPGNNAK